MSAAAAISTGQCLRVSNINWKAYSQFLRIFAEQPGYRLTYDRGELEIMSPLPIHDEDSRFLGEMVVVLTSELQLPRKQGGSVTIRRQMKEKGIEPDDCFWIANALRKKRHRNLDLRRDPPPDLAIEVDVTHSSMDRLDIYAALRVPELWQLNGNILTFHVLDDHGRYAIANASRSFPIVTPATVLKFLRRARKADDWEPVIQDFRAWIRTRLAKDA